MKKSDRKGAAMILTICIMAVAVVMCLVLLLTAAVVMNASTGEGDEEQCRILSVSLSRELESQLCSEQNLFPSQADEENAAENNTIWFYVKKNIANGSWRYYDESKRNHTARSAFRTFDPGSGEEGLASAVEADQITVTMYWETEDEQAEKITDGSTLTVQVEVEKNHQSCTITSKYVLNLNEKANHYEQWQWSLLWRE